MRRNFITDIDPNEKLDIAARPVPPLQRLYASSAVRRLLVVAVLGAAWQI